MEIDMTQIIRQITNDVRVVMSDEFDKNFERQAFFSEAWARKKSPVKASSPILIQTGALRRSVKSRIDGDSVVFYSQSPYAAIHNQGGEIRVTEKMKRFFWAMHYKASGGLGRKKNGELRDNKKNAQLNDIAAWWKAMALMKVGDTITIPKRQFLGVSEEVERKVVEVVRMAIDKALKN